MKFNKAQSLAIECESTTSKAESLSPNAQALQLKRNCYYMKHNHLEKGRTARAIILKHFNLEKPQFHNLLRVKKLNTL